jgi:hypothetical protein
MTPGVAVPKPEILRDPGYLAWLRWQPCVICEGRGVAQETSSDAAHTPRTRIHGDVALPLCRFHHEAEERLQPAAFAAKHALLLLEALARAYYRQYRARDATLPF